VVFVIAPALISTALQRRPSFGSAAGRNMAPYDEKVVFKPERKSKIRIIFIWIFGLVASGLFGSFVTFVVQSHLQYQCLAAIKSFEHCPGIGDGKDGLILGVAAMAAFACFYLWRSNAKS
jgi:hypothetical protein